MPIPYRNARAPWCRSMFGALPPSAAVLTDTELTHVVAVGDHGRGVKRPCGRDRQVLADYHPHVRVILPGPDGSVTASDLLPLAFDHSAEQV
ncbi:hypothetical protein [Curtobacterium sp. MCBD17_008]|uniref:hypothetical protein n=1 Tax=Curtobacterium sp. MCBD17_008 TaxID=2175656 RepID=UPI0011B799E0|nr:hypothetical protein [Curtobacterium sp. MCBD17_008]